MEKVKVIALTETANIKYEVQSTIALVKKIYQGQIQLVKFLKSEVEILKKGMVDAPRLKHWSEDMDS